MKVSLIVPVHNEALVIESSVAKLISYLEGQYAQDGYEVLLVENGSSDETPSLVRALSESTPEVRALQSEPGKGSAILRGWQEARGDVRVFIDADLSPSLATLEALVEEAEASKGLVYANRYHTESTVNRGWLREVVSRAWSRILSLRTALPHADYQCGAKAVHKDAFSRLNDEWYFQENGFLFDIELILAAHSANIPTASVPTQWVEFRYPNRKSSVPLLRTAWKFMAGVRRLKRRLRQQ